MTTGKETVSARVRRHMSVSPERVFDAWLDPEKIRVWMAAALKSAGLAGDIRRVEVDAREGGRFVFSDMRNEGEAVHWGSYLEIIRPQRLVFTWFTSEEDETENLSTVTLTLEPEKEGCIATIIHEMSAEWVDFVERTEAGWGRMLAQIDATSET